MNLAEQIRLQCVRKGSEPALSLGGPGPDTVSYGRLGRCVDAVCSRLHRLGAGPGSIYAIHTENRLMHVVLLLALERLGAATVSVGDLGECEMLRLTSVLSDRDSPPIGCPVLRVTGDWLQASGGLDTPVPVYANAPDDLCRIAFTSGSTGRPKPVALTHGVIAQRILYQDPAYGEVFKRSTRRLCCIGIDIGFGYRVLMRTLADGGLFSFPDQDLPRCVRGLALYRVQTLLGSPLQLADFAAYAEHHPEGFASLELVVCVGARLSPALAEEIRRRICPRVMVSYASEESGVAAAGSVETLDLERGEVGHLLPGVEVEIVDETSGLPMASGTGRIRIRSPGAAHGYGDAGDPDSRVRGEWVYTGDLGSVSPEGVLSITGRMDNVVNCGGVKTTLEAIEAELLAAPAVKDLAVTPTVDQVGVTRIIAFIVPQDGWSEPAFWDHCHTKIKRTVWPAKIVLVTALPRGPSGKVNRHLLPARLD